MFNRWSLMYSWHEHGQGGGGGVQAQMGMAWDPHPLRLGARTGPLFPWRDKH